MILTLNQNCNHYIFYGMKMFFDDINVYKYIFINVDLYIRLLDFLYMSFL